MNKAVVDYVKKYFDTHFKFYLDKFTMVEIEELTYGIARDIYNKFSIEQIKQGKVDAILHGAINEFLEYKMPGVVADYINFKNYVKNAIYGNYSVAYSEDTLNYLVDVIVNKLMKSYTYDDLMRGKVEKEIGLIYEGAFSELCNKMREYVKSYLINSIMPLMDVREGEIAEKMVKAIMTGSKYNATDLFLGKYDTLIENSAMHYEQEAKKNRPNSATYIFKIILNEDETLEDYVIQAYAAKIEQILRNRGLHASDIVSGKYDNEIVVLYRRIVMRNNSVKTDEAPRKGNNPNKMKHTPNKRKWWFGQRFLIIVALLASLGIGSFGYAVVDGIVDGVKGHNAGQAVNNFDGYSYTLIHTKYTDAYKPTAQNVLDFYSKVCEFGDSNYDCLGFYRAYSNVADNRLAIMDNMLSLVKNNARQNDKYSGLYNLIGNSSCYVEFACDRLVDMGCEEIQNEKYAEAVAAYKDAKIDANGDEIPFNLLSKKDQRLIEKIMEMYREYSEQWQIELGVLLQNVTANNLASGNGRSV